MKRQPRPPMVSAYWRLRIRRPDGGWTIGRPLYARARARRRADQLRALGLVVHLDDSGPGWHHR